MNPELEKEIEEFIDVCFSQVPMNVFVLDDGLFNANCAIECINCTLRQPCNEMNVKVQDNSVNIKPIINKYITSRPEYMI